MCTNFWMANVKRKNAGATPYLVLACIVASLSGFNFGYAVGISGGMTSMPQFNIYGLELDEFLENPCTRAFQLWIAAFTSSMYLGGLVACFAASTVTQVYGRKVSVVIGGFSILVGAVLSGAAQNLIMLILGRVMVGVGVGLGNQAVPIYLTEIAASRLRGTLSIMFQLANTFGFLCAILIINVGDYHAKVNSLNPRKAALILQRLPLGFGGVPATLMIIGGFLLPESPSSLIERGRYEQGRRMLIKLRGSQEVDSEYEVIIEQVRRLANSVVQSPFRMLLQRQSRPELIMALLIPFFQQLTGIIPILFDDEFLPNSFVTASLSAVATLISMANVDRWGRRVFFLEAGFQMFACLVAIGIKHRLSWPFKLVLSCLYFSAFAWSWGPLGWLLPSEIFPLKTRSAGQALAVSINMLFSIVVVHTFPGMGCMLEDQHRQGVFLFLAGCVFVMTAFVYWFVPETKKVPTEEMNRLVWGRHWFWRRFVANSNLPTQAS